MALAPRTGFTMTKESIRIMRTLLLPSLAMQEVRPWRPAVDIYRLNNGWMLKFELAGVNPEDIEVKLRGRRLTVRGVRLDRQWQAGCSIQHMEIAYSSFERAIDLPDDPGDVAIQAEFQNGMLYVHLREEQQP
jgi:HSP20 family protein